MTGPDERLDCGRPVDDVIGQVASGHGADLDAHQRNCPHCRAALAEYARLWAPVHELAAQHVPVPDGLLDSVLRRVRNAVEHREHGVLDSGRGLTRIAARVVVVTARETAQRVPGVRVALGRSVDHPVRAGVAGRSTAIEIILAADHGLDLPALAEEVRRRVAAAVRALTDLEPVDITIVIDEVLE